MKKKLFQQTTPPNFKRPENSISKILYVAPRKINLILNFVMIFKIGLFTRLMKYMAVWSIFTVGLPLHLRFHLVYEDCLLIPLGLFFVLPLAIQALNEQKWQITILCYLLVQVYPLYLFNTNNQLIKGSNLSKMKVAIFIVIHFVSITISLACRQKNCFELLVERQNVAQVKKEYQQILEQMPEGILILNKRGKIEFINEELREVLNVEEVGQESQGLYVKMFKSYNLEEDIDNFKEDDCISDCIHTIVEDDNWHEDEDRYFELDVCGCEVTRDEDRVFTQIRKLHIEFKEQPATMLLIRNITHIIKYEKARTQGKYQELLTATTSHEMLTPLNSILNLSDFLWSKLKKLQAYYQQKHSEELSNIQRKRQQLKYLSKSPLTKKDPQELLAYQQFQLSDLTDMEKLLLQQPKLHEKIVNQNNSVVEKDFSDALEYQHIIQSSAKILQFIVKDLIDLMNIKGGNFNPQIQNGNYTSLEKACQEILDCYKIQAREKNIFLKPPNIKSDERINARLAGICFDRQRYQQILLNLVQNGVKFTAVGEVEVIIEIELGNSNGSQNLSQNNGSYAFQKQSTSMIVKPFNVSDALKGLINFPIQGIEEQQPIQHQISKVSTIPVSCDLCGIIITKVKDTGIGMKKEVVQKLFKLFALAQKNSALSKGGIITTQGIGLGLSISKQLVEILGGLIRINTAPNQGTEVKFIVPFKCTNCLDNLKQNGQIGGNAFNQGQKNSHGKISQIFKSFINQDSIDNKSDLTSLTPINQTNDNALILGTGTGTTPHIQGNQAGGNNAIGSGSQGIPPPSPSTLRSWQPFGGDINFIPSSIHHHPTTMDKFQNNPRSTDNNKPSTSNGSKFSGKKTKAKHINAIRQCSINKKNGIGAESLHDIFGNQGPLANQNQGNQNNDNQFFFQTQESFITSDPQYSQRNAIHISDSGPNHFQNDIFDLQKSPNFRQYKSIIATNHLIEVGGDQDNPSIDKDSEIRRNSKTISEYNTVFLNNGNKEKGQNHQILDKKSQSQVQGDNNGFSMFCNKTQQNRKYEPSKFKSQKNQNKKQNQTEENIKLVMQGSSSANSGGFWSPRELSINDEINTSRDALLLSPMYFKQRQHQPNDLQRVGTLNHEEIDIIMPNLYHQKLKFDKQCQLIIFQDEVMEMASSYRPHTNERHSSTKKAESNIGFMINGEGQTSSGFNEQQHKIHEVIISDGSLLNNPALIQQYLQQQAQKLGPQYTSAQNFDNEKNYTAYFPVESQYNDDDSRQNILQTNFSRKSTMKKGNLGILFGQQESMFQQNQADNISSQKSGTNNNYQNYMKSSSLKTAFLQNTEHYNNQQEDLSIKNVMMSGQSKENSKSNVKDILSKSNRQNLHQSSIHLIQNEISGGLAHKNQAQFGLQQNSETHMKSQFTSDPLLVNTNTYQGQQKLLKPHIPLILNQSNALSTLQEAGADAEIDQADEDARKSLAFGLNNNFQSPFSIYNPRESRAAGKGMFSDLNSSNHRDEKIMDIQDSENSLKNIHKESVTEVIFDINRQAIREFCGSKNDMEEKKRDVNQSENSSAQQINQSFRALIKRQQSKSCENQEKIKMTFESQASRGLMMSVNSRHSRGENPASSIRSGNQQMPIRIGQYCQCPPGILAPPSNQQSDTSVGIMIVDDNTFNLMPLELILGSLNNLPCHKAFNGLEAVNLFKKSLQLASQTQVTTQQQQCECCYECGLIVKGGSRPSSNDHPQSIGLSSSPGYSIRMPQYKLILMDLNMPIMDGYDATKQIFALYNQWKADHAHQQLQGGGTVEDYKLSIVAVTAFVNEESVKECFQVGMQDALHKPVNAQEIKQVLDQYYYRTSNNGRINTQFRSGIQTRVPTTGFPGGY